MSCEHSIESGRGFANRTIRIFVSLVALLGITPRIIFIVQQLVKTGQSPDHDPVAKRSQSRIDPIGPLRKRTQVGRLPVIKVVHPIAVIVPSVRSDRNLRPRQAGWRDVPGGHRYRLGRLTFSTRSSSQIRTVGDYLKDACIVRTRLIRSSQLGSDLRPRDSVNIGRNFSISFISSSNSSSLAGADCDCLGSFLAIGSSSPSVRILGGAGEGALRLTGSTGAGTELSS